MQGTERPTLPAILDLLAAPQDGRLLTYGASTADLAMEIAASRPDLLIILCDTTSEVVRPLSDRCVAEKLDNIVIGDTHAGPPVDRSLAVGGLAILGPLELSSIRNNTLPGGYVLFVDEGSDGTAFAAQLQALGYKVTDVLESPFPGYFVVRAR